MDRIFSLLDRCNAAGQRSRDAFWSLVTGESLTSARLAMVDPAQPRARFYPGESYRALSPEEHEALQGFDGPVKVGDLAMDQVRVLAHHVSDQAFPPTELPHWPGLETLAAERDARDETGRHDSDGEPGSVLGRIRAIPAERAPHRNVGGFWEVPRLRRSWGERFDSGVLVASICIAGFFIVRACVSSPLVQALFP